MQGFTYTQLEQALKDWPEDDDPIENGYVDNIPRLTQLAELRVVKDLNLDMFDVPDTSAVVTANSRDVAKPAGLIVVRSMWLITSGVRTPILKRSRDFITNYAPNPSTTGTPKYYCEKSDVYWTIVPTPAAGATLETFGVYRPASLYDEESTWLGDNCGDLIFAAALMESEQFLKDDDRYKEMREKYYQELLPTARLELRNLIRSGDYAPYRPAAKSTEGA